MAWIEFTAAFGVFLLSHAVPVRAPVRPAAERLLGARGFTLVYSALSLMALTWLISAAGRAPFVPLWPWTPWQNHMALLAMLLTCLIFALAIGRPNPFSFGGTRNDRFEPAHPGIIRWTRHPLLIALALWAAAHLLPNGDLAHVLLFGIFALFALLGTKLVDRRKRQHLGAERWSTLRQEVQSGPILPRPVSWFGAILRLLAAIALYGTLVVAHPVVFGVSPVP
ncbi:NnrU family protein [Roseobacter weihaiensis]|uniref:NnrU family protein n=1 Tax=Roseobacter weihaiensis TaxID=2763262 RepID=UPI001D0B737F|nr:NnrU family protein [Roseobacter sp. H9]